MIGHSFGLVAAVYNYNRRSAFINDVLVKIFEMVAFNFYDDKYGFETAITAPSAKLAAEAVHFILGALFDEKKLQLSVAPVILGVTFNLEQLVLEIKEQRKQELLDTIDSVLESGTLDPGLAGKLKGKLMFGASQLWGKVGRAFFRPLSERQYMKDLHSDRMDLNPAIVRSLKYWRRLIQFGPAREISLRSGKPSDVVIFTDGFTPDQRKQEVGLDRIGAVMFDRDPAWISEKWIPRKTQIVPIEMIAPILAIETCRDHLRNKDVLLLIDSEAVEAALVKG
ncbi:URC1 [Symbiodinium sp. KB8]|nr:URC1 [Symbiodinium sp. KB8]